jgi:anti-sigma factor RsiW
MAWKRDPGLSSDVMNCPQVRPLLGPFLDGEIPLSERHAIQDHLEACPGCRGEYESLADLAAQLSAPLTAPPRLWTAIAAQLPGQAAPRIFRLSRRALGIAALLVAAVGIGLVAWSGVLPLGSHAHAACVDFGALLTHLPKDARLAFDRFLDTYGARVATEDEARRHGATLNFAIPPQLPGGFQRQAIYVLRFGSKPGVAVRYERDGELLAVIFHPPVLEEDYGTHEDRECVVGKHRGHAVAVGEWSLVHVTDPTTCHCILSRLAPADLPAIVAEVVPDLGLLQPSRP